MSRDQVGEIQRSRLIAAAARAVEELGYAEATVAQITHRARVSRRTFYELFANRDECLVAVLDDAVALIEGELAAAELEGLAWRERMRMGLWVILSCFDHEPALAHVCIVQALQGGPVLRERSGAILARLASVVDQGRLESARPDAPTSLAAEGLVGAALTILHSRLPRGQGGSLRDLHGELMWMIVLPYQGAAAARREQTRQVPTSFPVAVPQFAQTPRGGRDPLDGPPIRLTYRTVKVLEGICRHPGLSNRQIADYAGIADQGQVSKLLARLERLGLISNEGKGHTKGEPNAWKLAARGWLVAEGLRMHPGGGLQHDEN